MLAVRTFIPIPVVAFTRRHASSTLRDKIGTFQPRPKPPAAAATTPPVMGSASSSAAAAAEAAEEEAAYAFIHNQPLEGEVIALVPTETKVKNAALATTLVAFCFGIALYSMNAVGQAGTDPDDPLSALRKEAAVAQEQQDRDDKAAGEAADMLQKFQKGEFDPDRYEELEENPSKRPWYKFW